MFYPAPEDEDVVHPSYFHSFERELVHKGVSPHRYDEDHIERSFRHLEYATVPSRLSLDHTLVRVAFSIPPEYEIERPGREEVPFEPRVGGWIALPMAHLRLGLWFPLYRFVYHLFQNYLCCSLY